MSQTTPNGVVIVGVTGLEPATSCSQSTRATNCATPRRNRPRTVLYRPPQGVLRATSPAVPDSHVSTRCSCLTWGLALAPGLMRSRRLRQYSREESNLWPASRHEATLPLSYPSIICQRDGLLPTLPQPSMRRLSYPAGVVTCELTNPVTDFSHEPKARPSNIIRTWLPTGLEPMYSGLQPDALPTKLQGHKAGQGCHP